MMKRYPYAASLRIPSLAPDAHPAIPGTQKHNQAGHNTRPKAGYVGISCHHVQPRSCFGVPVKVASTCLTVVACWWPVADRPLLCM